MTPLVWKLSRLHRDIFGFFIVKQNKEASPVLCSVIEHLGSGRALEKWGKTLDYVSYVYYVSPELLSCSTSWQHPLQQKKAQSRFYYFVDQKQLPVHVYLNHSNTLPLHDHFTYMCLCVSVLWRTRYMYITIVAILIQLNACTCKLRGILQLSPMNLTLCESRKIGRQLSEKHNNGYIALMLRSNWVIPENIHTLPQVTWTF